MLKKWETKKHFISVGFNIEICAGNLYKFNVGERKQNANNESNFVKTGKINIKGIKRICTKKLAFVFSGY